jgi:hypothetical protein
VEKKKMLVTYVNKKLAKRFYADLHTNIEAICPYCKVQTEIAHGDAISTFDLPEKLIKKVVYPSIGLCQNCGKTFLLGFEPLRAKK